VKNYVGWCSLAGAALLAAALSAQAQTFQSGFRTLKLPYYDGYMDVALWYPSVTPEADTGFGPYRMQVAMRAPVAPGVFPLIVISHGTGGSSLSHYHFALALAHAGFIVAAPMHPGDNYRDRSLVADVRFPYERPRQLSRVLDELLADPEWKDRIDRNRIGAIGHSAGGYTVAALIGGVPDWNRLRVHCETVKDDPACAFADPKLGVAPGGTPLVLPASATASGNVADPRIGAAMLLAPLGFGFAPGSFKDTRATVALIGAEFDEALARQYHYEYLRQQLPSAAARLAPGAGHYSFIAPPIAEFRAAFGPAAQDPSGFDREVFQSQLSAEVVEFFRKALR
jgi:predicted dienelactone hydrolase